MTRRSASRGILYSTPPAPDTNDSEEASEAASTETNASEPAAADD